MQYCIISNDIALIMHYRALLQMPGQHQCVYETMAGAVSLKKPHHITTL